MRLDPDKMITGWRIVLIVALVCVIMFIIFGCGSSQSVKPTNSTKTASEAQMEESLENQEEMWQEIGTMRGDLSVIKETTTNINKTISTVIKNSINSELETLQDSQKNVAEKIGRIQNRVNKNVNSMWYGIGLVIAVLMFLLAVIFIFVYFNKKIKWIGQT